MTLEALEARLKPAMLAARAGDQAAYRLFLDLLSVRLRAYVRNQLVRAGRGEATEVEDVLQETLLALHVSQHTYDPEEPVTAWAHAIARYKTVDHLRRTGRHAANIPLDDALPIADGASAEAPDTRLDLARALQSVSPRTRALIEQVKVEGYSIAEAATRAGMTESAAKVAIHRGLQALARALRTR